MSTNNNFKVKHGLEISNSAVIDDTNAVYSVPVTLPGNPTNNLHATTKQYVQQQLDGVAPVGVTGQVPFITVDGTRTSTQQYIVQTGQFVENDNELNTAKTRITTPSTVFNTWYRFSHNTTDTQPASSSEITSWVYDSVNDQILSTVNSTTYIGFVSADKYTKYINEVRLSSTVADDDVIGILLAWYTDPVTGRQYTLSALRDPGGNAFTWQIVYNYNRSDAWVVADKTSVIKWGNGNYGATAAAAGYVANPAYGCWDDYPTGTKIRVVRDGDVFTVQTTDLGSETYVAAANIMVDLTSDPRLEKFRGASSIGYSCFSQQSATFKVLEFSDVSSAIYDVRDGSMWVYTNSVWTKQTTSNIWNTVGTGRIVLDVYTRKTYFIKPATVEILSGGLTVQGYTGSQGVIGYTGSQGSIGYVGSQGSIGYVGSRGYTGSQGSQGTVGYVGSQGTTGYVGSQGIQGVIGYTGSQGTTGYVGSRGYTGSQGVIGYTGSQGIVSAADVTNILGFVPVQQGGVTGQGTNKVYIGWSSTGDNNLNLCVDTTNFGSYWPITAVTAAGLVTANSYQVAALGVNTAAPTTGGIAATGDITTNGQVYITGTSSNYLRMRNGSAGAWQFYDVKDPDDGIYNYTVMMDNGHIGFYFSTVDTAYDIGTIKHTFGANGDILAVGNVTAYYSDERLKTKLGNITDALDKVDAIDCFYYEANDVAKSLGYEAKREVGVSAQTVQAVLPEVVAPAPVSDEYLTVHYDRLVPLLIQAVKDLRAEVNQLKQDKGGV